MPVFLPSPMTSTPTPVPGLRPARQRRAWIRTPCLRRRGGLALVAALPVGALPAVLEPLPRQIRRYPMRFWARASPSGGSAWPWSPVRVGSKLPGLCVLAAPQLGSRSTPRIKTGPAALDVADLPAVRAARDAVTGTAQPPASTAAQVAALSAPDYLLEAQAWALAGHRPPRTCQYKAPHCPAVGTPPQT